VIIVPPYILEYILSTSKSQETVENFTTGIKISFCSYLLLVADHHIGIAITIGIHCAEPSAQQRGGVTVEGHC